MVRGQEADWMKRVKTYLEDEAFFDLEEGVCNCGIEPQDLETTDFVYVQINGLGVPACRKCHMLMISKERLTDLLGIIVAGAETTIFDSDPGS